MLGYLLIAKHPSGLTFRNVFIGDAILGEADTLSIGNGIITGSLAVSRWTDNQVGIGAYIILAATGKGKRKKCGYKSQLPRYGGVNLLIIIMLSFYYY